MDIKIQANSIKLISQLADRENSTSPVIKYSPQKIAFDRKCEIKQRFERATPESQGVSSRMLRDFYEELCADKNIDLHSVTVLRHGKVISEGYFGAYRPDVWHITYSLCKSITGLAIGMLIDEGRLTLDTRLVDIFNKRLNTLSQVMLHSITIKHLLTMTTGVTFNEAGSVTDTDWVRSYLETVVKPDGEKRFEYNSMNSYMLSAIVKQITGEGLTEYLRPRLFEPLGIEEIHWERCPKGIEKGGWGLYICAEDMAKLGQLVLQRGVWNGQRIISEKWIREATCAHMKTPENYGDYNYGYHFWVGRAQNSFLMNGMFSQNIFGFYDSDMVIVTNAGNNELFQQSDLFSIVHKYFGPERSFGDRLTENNKEHRRLKKLLGSLYADRRGRRYRFFARRRLNSNISLVCGRQYEISPKHSAAVGTLPLFSQVMQNNYTKGLKGISFEQKDGRFYVNMDEGDELYRFCVGFTAPEYSDISVHGEPYIVGTSGFFATDEDDTLVLKLRMSFIETASTRTLKIFFSGDSIRVEIFESPGVGYIYEGVEIFLGGLLSSKSLGALTAMTDSDFIELKLKQIFEPTLLGTLK